MKRLKRLNSTTPEGRIINEMIAELESLKLTAGRGIRLTQTAKGTSVSATSGGPGGEPPPSDWYQGDYNPALSYDTGHGVSVRGGLTAGLYIAIDDVPAGTAPTPALTTPWVMVASSNPGGFWM